VLRHAVERQADWCFDIVTVRMWFVDVRGGRGNVLAHGPGAVVRRVALHHGRGAFEEHRTQHVRP
jgi:hypothetical protein